MAGAGWRTFTIGQLLTSAQVQTFLQDQSIQVHASAAARSSALGTAVSEGMVSYRTDGKALELYANSSWTPVMQNRNQVLNSAFDIWQRGTSFSHTGPSVIYMADRWGAYRGGFASGSTTSRQASGLTGFQYSARVQRDSGNTSTATIFMTQAFETAASLPLAGQTVTLSFWAKSGANFSSSGTTLGAHVVSGTGTDQTMWAGFSGYTNVATTSPVLTSSWQRFTVTGTVGSTATQLAILFFYAPTGTAGANDWFEVTGVQLETGSVATPFVRATTTLQGELAACQRYYQRYTSVTSNAIFSGAMFISTTFYAAFVFPKMRTAPSASVSSAAAFNVFGNGTSSITSSAGLSNLSDTSAEVQCTTGAILAGGGAWARWNGTTGQYFFELSAEL
jgi:hypothetical protein